jgi:hypothetical protein
MKTYVRLWYYLAEFFLECEIFQSKIIEKIKTNVLCATDFFLENRALYEIMWKNMEEPGRPQITKQYGAEKMRFACRIAKTRIQTHARNI